jgi:imidazolonepropionase-like amidohydrolase
MRPPRLIVFVSLMLGMILASTWQRDALAAEGKTLALVDAKIYPSPTATPIVDGVVLVQDGKIAAVGKAGKVRIPAGGEKLDCTGLVITAGFQNSHVHFTEPKWDDAAHQPASKLSAQLADMFTRYGFTTVVDLASLLDNTVALRSRIQSGEVVGPRILTAGEPLYPPRGTPFYLGALPPDTIAYMESNLEPATPTAAIAVVQHDVAGGADVIKLFTGSLISPTEVKPMPPDIAAAAVAEAHRHNRLVFAHPSNLEGLEIALDAGVDVAAHTTPMSGKWGDALIAKMKEHHMSLTPTLKLWISEAMKGGDTSAQAEQFANAGVAELGQYESAGGQILFGTDVGYMTDCDPTEEYVLMARVLTPMQILDSLTTAPAARFGESKTRGRVAPGMDADLVVLGADPAADARNFVNIRYTIRHGSVIYPVAAR